MRVSAYFIWPCVFIGQLLTTSLLAWHLLAQIDFAYPTGYKLLHLDKNIAEFAPLNHYKKGFEYTTAQEHWNLFAQITDAVQHQGKGLAEISYRLPNGIKTALMRSEEITHLQDVSHLIDTFYKVGLAGLLVWSAAFFIAYRQKLPFPSLRNMALGFSGGILIIASIILTIGATKVFYWFHTKIFPSGHQWFFYYEDSLMTTLMKAPDIFAFIACLLMLVLCIIWGSTTYLMWRSTGQIAQRTSSLKKLKRKNKQR